MKMKNLIKYCLFGLVILSSCEEEVSPPQIEKAENKVVVNGLIAPSLEQISIQVSQSRKAFGTIEYDDSDLIANAQVTISNGSSQGILVYDPEMRVYTISTSIYPIIEGETYRIDVETTIGAVFGETTIPKRIVELSSAVLNQDNTLDVSWMDIENESNYYRVIAEGEVGGEFAYSDSFYFENDEFISDANREGELISAKGEGYPFGGGYENVIIKIISCNKNYFEYYKILVNYQGEDPFADPVRLPSNIHGGLGIFTSVQISEFTIEQ
jgi:hypothetical protein